MTSRPPPVKRVPLWAVFIALIGLLFLASTQLPAEAMQPILQFDEENGDQLKATLDQLNLLSQLMIGLNTSLIAGALAVSVHGRSWNPKWNGFDSAALLLVLSSGATVYYGVYLAYIIELEMVANGFLDPFSPRLDRALAIQYRAFMLGFLLLGIVFCRLFERRNLSDGVEVPNTREGPFRRMRPAKRTRRP